MCKKEIFWCKSCLNMSTRPRITFDDRGYCNACQWLEEKKIMDWKPRERDGTGFGYDFDNINSLKSKINIPLIIAGGAGNDQHLMHGLKDSEVDAVATANLFNFVGDGLPNARELLLSKGINLAKWSKY